MSSTLTQDRYINGDVDREWKTYNPSNDENGIVWEDYRQLVYGFLDTTDGVDETEDQTYRFVP